ncbi:MAG TPA: RHS repeat-associated core domain-containing protein, partial [Ktedonosporobacter sp.]|nr:RHS repeat-associated core domain-containing protein [Ktedonosporobacter sp.]
MTCRTPTGPQVCTSSQQTGASLTSDAEGRLIRWVSADGATTVSYGYDGEGNRFEMQVVTSSSTTTTTYISTLEEIQVVGGATTKIVYFSWNGQRVAEDDNTHWYYLLNDGLLSTTVVVDFSGVQAAQLFAPYGQTRWAGGTLPTSYAFTGQRADSATGLDYYNARSYDPAAGRFLSADSVLPGGGMDPTGLDRYAYVGDNPSSRTDPTGHGWFDALVSVV